MENFDISKLNNEQLNALKQTDGPILVTAGAGSGKTRLLTYRIVDLIKNHGVMPSNILAITFTNKAASEMKERISKMVSEDADKIWISTFHAMCSKILRKNIKSLEGFDSNFSIYSESDKDKTLKIICDKLEIASDEYKSEAAKHIGNAKNENLSPWEYQRLNPATKDIEVYTKIYSAYQAYLKSNNALDFDDLLIKVYELFKVNPEILSYYQNKFLYINVDEFQDTNSIQYQIVKLLALKNKNIFVVGDEDQCIYGWRGANINNMLNFKKDFPEYKLFKLEQNYRSTKQILKTANSLIKNNFSRLDKVLWTANNDGVMVENYVASNETEESEYVASTIFNLVRNGNYKYSDFAVLLRLNALSRPFEEKFLSYNLPYQVFGGYKFFERQEIKDIIAYLRVFVNPQDSTSLLRIVNVPKRGIGDSTINQIMEMSEAHSVSPLNLIFNCDEFMLSQGFVNKILPLRNLLLDLNEAYKEMPAKEFISYCITKTELRKSYEEKTEENLNKLLNIDAFLASVEEYFSLNENHSLIEYLESITLISDIDSMDDKNNSVSIATVHSAKGLEFKVVFIVALEEKYFPILRSSGFTDMEEERRLMYVAITRAMERLYLTRSSSRYMYGKRDFSLESRFIKESGIKTSDYETISYKSSATNQNFPSFGFKESFKLSSAQEPIKASKTNAKSFDYTVGDKVNHTKFGVGTVTGIDTSIRCLTVVFDGFGAKTLMVDYAPITKI